MLINLQTFYKPKNLTDAAERLKQPGAYPVFGGGASLFRASARRRREIETAVDLSELVSAQCEANNDNLRIGSAATLESIGAWQPELRTVVNAEAPLTLRNTLTLGDLLLSVPPGSLVLALLYGLGARIDYFPAPGGPARGGDDLIEIGRWVEMHGDERRQYLVQGVVLPRFVGTQWRFAIAKVARTPHDKPIVAAIGFAYAGEPDPGSYAVVIGLDDRPVRYAPGIVSKISDYKGSAAYRTEMAKILSEQAIAEALAKR